MEQFLGWKEHKGYHSGHPVLIAIPKMRGHQVDKNFIVALGFEPPIFGLLVWQVATAPKPLPN